MIKALNEPTRYSKLLNSLNKNVLTISLSLITLQFGFAQVGVNTTDPQEALHIAGPTGTLRVESLNAVNNGANGGDVNGDLDLTNDTFPLYVDKDGEFTLEYKPFFNSNGTDYLVETVPGSGENSVTLLSSDADGKENIQITLFSVTVSAAAILEVKYNMSFEVYLDPTKTVISDNIARRISTYFVIDGVGTRKYGPVSKCYTSGTTGSVVGTMFNTSTAYIQLPGAGTYDLKFYGEVSSNVKGAGGGSTSKATYVDFATGYDSIFLALH